MHIRTRLFASTAALALATLLPAQAYGPEELIARRQQKLQSEFLKKADWFTDYDRARTAAKEREQLIFAYFTRSDAPAPLCSSVENGPLSDPRIAELGKRAVLFAHITSRTPDEPHANLFREKGGNNYPAVMILDASGELLTRQPNSGLTVAAFADAHDTVSTWLSLKERRESGDRSVVNELFIAELKLNKIPYDAALRRASRLMDLTDEQEAEISNRMINLEFFWKVNSLGGGSPEEVSKNLLVMKQIGHIPTGDAGRQFWMRIAEYAKARRDADLYEDSLKGMREILGDDPRFARYLSEMAQTLKEMRGQR